MTSPSGRTGRRPGNSDAKARIAQEARRLFAAHGHDAVSLRQIATAAEVDVALITHYYGGKARLFTALTVLPFDPRQVLSELSAPGLDGLGERTVRFMLTTLRSGEQSQSLLSLLRTAGTHSEIGEVMREQYIRELLEPLARDIQADQPELRAALCASQLLGLSFAEQILSLSPLHQASTEKLAHVVGRTLQRYLTEPL